MVPRAARIVILMIMLAGFSCLSSVIYADNKSGALLPVIPMGQGESCVKDTDFMRRNHMELLKHQRDETTLRGVRDEQYSLKACLNCHAVYSPDATAVSFTDPTHFCRSCHDYAAVSIDCFQCHASRPEKER